MWFLADFSSLYFSFRSYNLHPVKFKANTSANTQEKYMQHCYTAIYSTDCFCPDCGDEIEKHSMAKSVLDIDPNIFDLVPIYKVNTIFTGQVQRSYYYTLHHLNDVYARELNSPYCWLELLDADGKELKINISADFKNIDTINVGDTVSVCGNFSDKIDIPRFNTIDKSIVKNLDFASCVILHSGNDIIDNSISSNKTSVNKINYENNAIDRPIKVRESFKAFIHLHVVLSLAFYFLMFYFTGGDSLSIVVPLLYFFFVAPTLHMFIRNRLLYKYNELINTLIKIAAITPKQLGCEYIKRSFKSGDFFCDDCNHPIAFGAAYCVNCGHKLMNKNDWAFNTANK